MKPKRPQGFAQEGALTSPRSRAAWSALKQYHPYRYGAYRSWAPELLKRYKGLNEGRLVSTAQDPDIEESPEEYSNLNNAWGQLYHLISQHVLKAAKGIFPATPYAHNVQMAADLLIGALNQQGQLHSDHPLQRVFGSFVGEEAKLYSHWASHTLNNRAIFDFTPELVSMFTRSNVGDALIDQINLPAETVYLHFGVQVGFPLRGRLSRSADNFAKLIEETGSEILGNDAPAFLSDPGWDKPKYYLEGAYVSRNRFDPEGSLEILLIGRALDSDPKVPPQNFIEASDEMIPHQLPCISPGTVQAALNQERERNNRGHIAALKRGYELVKSEEGSSETLFEGEFGSNVLRHIQASEVQTYADFERSLSVVLNALLYVTSYPEELDTEYPPTPLEISPLIEKAEGDCLQRETRRAQAQLEDLGYVKIKFCGRRITQKARQLAKRNEAEGRSRTFKGRLGTWRFLDSTKGFFKQSRHTWVRPSPDPTGTKSLTIYEVSG